MSSPVVGSTAYCMSSPAIGSTADCLSSPAVGTTADCLSSPDVGSTVHYVRISNFCSTYQISDICPHSSTNKLATYDCTLVRHVISTPVNAHQLLFMHLFSSMYRTAPQDRTLSLPNCCHYQCGRYLSHSSHSFLGLDSWTIGQCNGLTLGQ